MTGIMLLIVKKVILKTKISNGYIIDIQINILCPYGLHIKVVIIVLLICFFQRRKNIYLKQAAHG